MKPDEIIFELIKFDMEQIRHYGEAILNMSSMSIIAAFTISAFVYGKTMQSVSDKKTILITTHLSILLILAIAMFFYTQSIDASRSTLEMRECALKARIDEGREIDSNEIYPGNELLLNPQYSPMYEKCNPSAKPHISSYNEKYPIPLAMIFILFKLLIEIRRLTKRRLEKIAET